jgi:hypothetical protein
LLLICNGWVGTAFFLSFFGYLGWRYRRDKTPYGMAGVLVILLSFLYMFAYTAVTAPLEFIMIAVALLWRNDQWLRTGTVLSIPAVRRVWPARQARWAKARYGEQVLDDGTPCARRHDLQSVSRPDGRAGAGTGRRSRTARTDGRLAEVARGGLLNLVGAAVAGLGTVALTLIIARTFSKAAAGAFFTAMSLFLIVEAVASLGAATGTVYFIARLRSLGQHQRIPEVMRTATRPVAVVSVTAAVILFLLAGPVARLLVHGQLGHAGARTRGGRGGAAGPRARVAVRGDARCAGREPRLPRRWARRSWWTGSAARSCSSRASAWPRSPEVPRCSRRCGRCRTCPPRAPCGCGFAASSAGRPGPHPGPRPGDRRPSRSTAAGRLGANQRRSRSRCGSGGSPGRAAWPRSRRSPFSASTSSWSPSCAARQKRRSTPPRPGSWWPGNSATRPSAWPPSLDSPRCSPRATARAPTASTRPRPPGSSC